MLTCPVNWQVRINLRRVCTQRNLPRVLVSLNSIELDLTLTRGPSRDGFDLPLKAT